MYLSWLDPLWLTDWIAGTLSLPAILSTLDFFPPYNTIFWFIGLISLCWSTEDVKRNLQRVLMVCSTDSLAALNISCHMQKQMEKRVHIFTNTLKHACIQLMFAMIWGQIICPKYPADVNKVWSVSSLFNYHKHKRKHTGKIFQLSFARKLVNYKFEPHCWTKSNPLKCSNEYKNLIKL